MNVRKKRVLFLCTGNSCRSQMAEGFLKHAKPEHYEVYSAGSLPAGDVHLLAVEAMQELDIDISQHWSKSIEEFLPKDGKPNTLDLLVTVCDAAAEECPVFPAEVEKWNWSFTDPAKVAGTEEEKTTEFRRVRDEIRTKIAECF